MQVDTLRSLDTVRRWGMSLVVAVFTLLSGCGSSTTTATRAHTMPEPPGDSGVVRVGTFNIRFATANDGPNAWSHRQALVVGMIDEGDFWGLQEVLPEQAAEIAQRLPHYGMVIRTRERSPTEGEACPILYRRDRWTVDPKEQGTFWLSETPDVPGSKSWDAALPRIATWARCVERTTGRGIYVINVHFDHRGSNARRAAASVILAWVRQTGTHEPIVLLGDFNTGPESAPIAALLGSPDVPLVDAWRAAHPTAAERPTFNGWADSCHGDRIDFIFASPSLTVRSCEIDDRKREGRWPSDHAAVRATLQW